MELFKSRTRVAYTNAVGDKVYPVIVDIKRGIKSTEEIQFMSSDINTGILSVAFIQGNENYNVSGAEVVCSVMRPDASTLDIPCTIVENNIVEVPLGINGTSQDGIYSFDFKVFKGGNKVVGTPIMNYSVSLSISNDNAVLEDDRLPVLTMLMTQVSELHDRTDEAVAKANTATEATKVATANAIEATNKANETINKVTQDTANAIAEVNATSDTMVENVNNAISSMDTTVNSKISEMTDTVNDKISEVDTAKNEMINDVSSTKANLVTEVTNAKDEMTNTVTNKVNEVEGRFNALTASQQQSSEVIDARDGETSLKARLDRDIEKAKQVYINVEGSHISTDSSSGYLKDVEILGNTIQDEEDLADIRSVGDKVEGQELYEIPVLSRGKNLFNIANLTQFEVQSNNGITASIEDNKIYMQGTVTNTYDFRPVSVNYNKVLYSYVNNKPVGTSFTLQNNIGASNYWSVRRGGSVQYLTNTIIIQEGDTEIGAFVRLSKGTILPKTLVNIQIEEGTVATPYEPYQEDKSTILSPVQLEKVGDVADRIVEKNGVWGVEKNVKTVITNGIENITLYQDKTNTMVFKIPYSDLKVEHSANIISDKFVANKNIISGGTDVEGICVYSNGNVYVAIDKTKLTVQNVEGFKTWLENNSLNIKYPTNITQFTSLPHDQQIKLRTFANKTNISFLTEIEGTIKAQVPKSLGATVNTHTEQINNLNKELDRVKKLEESTVSTVETESDFTTVEATSNGYFEDVKLEGKTLVNLAKNSPWIYVTKSANKEFDGWQQLKPNTQYTFILLGNTINVKDILISNDTVTEVILSRGNRGTCFTFTTPLNLSSFTLSQRIYIYSDGNDLLQSNVENWNIIILEGDHTQNPPSYFEGLKSVGDGADEIVVLSNNNGNLVNSNMFSEKGLTWANGTEYTVAGRWITDFIEVSPRITLERDNKCILFLYDKNKNYLGNEVVGYKSNSVANENNYKIESDVKYIRVQIDNTSYKTIYLGLNKTNKEVVYKQDKKRLLFYNNETQTWEKPILRQWDSIEKHSDGKYYYHQRSGEVVLNGSEDWSVRNDLPTDNPQGTHLVFYVQDENFPIKARPNDTSSIVWISDIIQPLSHAYGWNTSVEGLHFGTFSKSQGANNCRYFINITKSKLSTQDVQGFKQWLQTNNVIVVYQLAQEKVYECTNIDLITYTNETNYIVECGAISPKSILKVHNNISNIVKILQEKVSLLESNVKASQEVQDMMILETDMRMLDIELALMEFVPMKLNLGGSSMLRSATYFNFVKNHIVNETYEKEYLENVMNKYLATGRINQDEYDELYKMLYPPVYDIELPIEP